jgi:hypothetical protein
MNSIRAALAQNSFAAGAASSDPKAVAGIFTPHTAVCWTTGFTMNSIALVATAQDPKRITGNLRATIDTGAVGLESNDGWPKSCKLVIA